MRKSSRMAPKERQTIEIEKLTETSYFRSIKQLPFIARTFLGRHCRQLTNQRTFSRWSESNLSGLVLSQVAWKPLPDPDVPVTFRESDSVPKINSILLKNMRTLLHLFADLLHSSKKQPYSFQAIPHSLSKNLGVGGAPFLGPRKLCLFVRCQTKLSQARAEACLLAQGDGRARSDCSRKVLWFRPCCSRSHISS